MLVEVVLEDGRGVESVAVSRTCSTCTTCSLRCRSFRDPVDFERLDAARMIVFSLISERISNPSRTRCKARILTSFARPVSTTYLMFGIVMAVSATFVAITTRRCPAGGSAKTFICFSVGSKEYRGRMWRGSARGRKRVSAGSISGEIAREFYLHYLPPYRFPSKRRLHLHHPIRALHHRCHRRLHRRHQLLDLYLRRVRLLPPRDRLRLFNTNKISC